MPRKCAIPSCDNILAPNARLDECHNCRQVFRYWLKKRPDEVIERQRKLTKWQERMIRLGSQPKGKKHAKAARKILRAVERRAA